MKLNKLITTVLIILSIIGLVYAVTSTTTSFYSQTNPLNVTFSGEQNITYYLEIPMYAYVNNVTIQVEGFAVS